MTEPTLRRLLLAFLLFTSLPLLGVSLPPFAHEASDLVPEDGTRFGKLPNGLRYVLRANAEPKGRASLRLLVEAGSLHETDSQRGLAHFLEHMAFNGSTHYPPGTLVEFFQRMGMSFGGDTNASTSFDRTLYLLELADTREATLLEGLRVFNDYAGGLLLLDFELNKERGIILAEKRARDNVGFRTFVAQFEFALGETLLPKRIPIGLVDVIQNAPRAEFVDFYDTWYRPELITVVAVGDFDVAWLEAKLIEIFTPLKARAPARAVPDRGRVSDRSGLHVHHHPEPESPATSISLGTMVPYSPEPDTAAARLRNLPRSVAHAMLNRRFSILAKKEGAVFVSARASAAEQFDLLRETSIDLTAKAENWAAALAVGEQELRRALAHGFQPGELAEVRASYLNSLEQAVRTAPTRRSEALADDFANDVLRRRVSTSPQAELALFRPALERLTPEACLAALREAWSANHRLVMVSGNAVIPDGTRAIADAYEKARSAPVEPAAREADVTWGYTDFGPAGSIVARDYVDDLEITRVTFANGVRLNLKRTSFEAGRILLNARAGLGAMTEPAGQRGLAAIAGATFVAGGLGRHSSDDLQRILAGRTVSVGFRPAPDAFELGGATTRDDLLLTLQLLAARLVDPGFRPEALRLAHKGLDQMYLSFPHNASGPLSTEVASLLAGGDPRFGTPPREVMFARTLDEVRAWLAPQLASGPLELALVGDLDTDAAIAAAAATVGALPPRQPRPNLDHLRQVRFPAQPFARDFTISSQIPKGVAVYYWPTTDGMDARVSRRLGLLGSVFNDRLRVRLREEMGSTYSPSLRSFASDAFPGYGYLNAGIDIDPATAESVTRVMAAISDDLKANGVTEDELDRARQPALSGVRTSARTNVYWLSSVLSRAQEKPEVLDWARSRESDFAAITKAEIDALARAYLGSDRMSRAIVVPRAP